MGKAEPGGSMLDQLTKSKRAEFFTRRNFEDHITAQQKEGHLNTVKLIRGVPRGLRLIGGFGLNEREIALRKALFVSRRSAKIADATVDANVGICTFEKMDPEQKSALWGQFYDRAMVSLRSRPEVNGDQALTNQIIFLQRFFSLPKKIYEARERHWRIIERVTRRLTENHIDPKENYLHELDRLVKKASEGTKDIRKLAMDVCVASSVYADMKSREGERWSDAYQDGMELAYPKMRGHHELIEAIASL